MKKIGFLVLCLLTALFFVVGADAQTTKKKAKKKPKKTVQPAPKVEIKPTFTRSAGTVASYFFPTDSGTAWQMRTIRMQFDDTGKIVSSDTTFNEQRVSSNKGFSLQRLPLVICETKGYKLGGLDTAVGKAYYYVDDSIAMTVMNNSVSNIENRVFLVAPLHDSNAWHEKYEDSVYCAIESMTDSVEVPVGRFDSVLTTVTRVGYTELRKYYVQGYGLVKILFRAPGPGGRGLMAIKSEMMALAPGKKEESVNTGMK
ncbi:MAG TPA: hypothetical protein VIX80_03195 [Candidatus Kapabacteria bacterium]